MTDKLMPYVFSDYENGTYDYGIVLRKEDKLVPVWRGCFNDLIQLRDDIAGLIDLAEAEDRALKKASDSK